MRRVAIPLITILAAVSLVGTAYASWSFASAETTIQSIQVMVPTWSFGSVSAGAVIVVDEDGNVTIDGEPATATVSSDGESYNYGDVTIKIEADADGNLVLTEFTTSNQQFALWGSTIYLPTSVEIGGVIYPVTGVAEPLQINVTDPWIGTQLYNNHVYVPSGYTYLCDSAFASLTQRTTFHLPDTIETIGTGVFMPDRNITQTINYGGTQTQWNAINKANNYENGRGSISINYNS